MAEENDGWAKAKEITRTLCMTFEGCSLQPYLCPSNMATIGYGATFYEGGMPVTLSDVRISKDRALELLDWHIGSVFMPALIKVSPVLIRHPLRLAAITDFVFNCGVPRYRASTLCRAVNRESWGYAKDQLMKWTRGGGRVLPGLVRRRQAEAALL